MQIRLGLVGAGGMGQMAHLRNYAAIRDCQVVALAERRPELARRVAARYGVPRVYATHLQMLESEKLDGVVAILPFGAHAAILPDVYPRVRHVLTEKPLADSVEAGERLVEAASRAGCTHMVGYHKRSDPATVAARRTIDEWRASGKMGRLTYVRILMPAGDWIAGGFAGLIETDEPAPAVPSDAPKEYVAFVNYYIHQVNLMRHLLGEPYRVTFADRTGVLLAVESASGAAGAIEMTPYRTTLAWEESALVAFEKGYLLLRLPAPVSSNRAGTLEIYTDGERRLPEMPWVHAMGRQAENFIRVCRGEIEPPCGAAEAVEDLKIARDYLRMKG